MAWLNPVAAPGDVPNTGFYFKPELYIGVATQAADTAAFQLTYSVEVEVEARGGRFGVAIWNNLL